MRDRVLGIETEYAVIYHPGRVDRGRPSKLALYRRFEGGLRRRVRSLPNAFSPLRGKGGRFLENYPGFAETFLPDGKAPHVLGREIPILLAGDAEDETAPVGYHPGATGSIRP